MVDGEASHHPSVDLAVGLFQSLNDSTGEHVIRDFVGLCDAHAHRLIELELLVHQLCRVDADEAELLGDDLGLRGATGAGWPDQHYLWGLAGGAVTESDAQNPGEIVGGFLNVRATFILVDKLVEISLDFPLVDVPLTVNLSCRFTVLRLGELSVKIADTVFYVFHRGFLRACHLDELVGDDSQFGKSVSLHTGSGEAFQDPALVLFLSLLDLLVDEFDDQFVVNITECFRCL